MGERAEVKRMGCGQVIVIGSMLLWLGVVLVGVMFLTDSASGVAVTAAIAVAAVALLLPFVGVALLTRRRAGWEATAAAASGFVTTAGYFLLDVAMRAMSPEGSIPAAPLSLQAGGALRLGVLFPYALLAAWLAPRLAGAARRRLWEWLGLNRFDLPTLLLSLAVAALVTVPWPVTGALGDSLTSLSLVFQTLVWAIPLVLIFWGVIFCLLTSTFARPWAAALTTIVLYGLSMLSGVLPVAGWGVLEDGIYLLPMALLLTELRARECGIYPLLLVAFCYRVAPLLFMDPRDIVVNGAPEPQHIVSYRIVVMTVSALSMALWGGRRLLLLLRGRVQVSAWIWAAGAAFVMFVAWGAWGGLYIFAGEPGFANDGFLIILEEQAGGSTALAEVLSAAYAIPDREVRSQYIYETMVEAAGRTQAPLRAELDALGVSYRPYYIINMIRVDGHRWLMRRFEGRPGVARVLLNPNVREYPRSVLSSYYGGDGEPSENVQPNLAAIHADEAWAMGVTGEGIVVAGQDTGYDWTHPALKSHYRGWDGQSADHDTNWHDAWDGTSVPFDDDSHGTHTMGIALGDDGAGNRTGVAPGAQWIGCRNMRRGFGNPGSYAECMEFFLAPYPHGGDPFTDGDVSLAPHVINNSWSCPDFEGCFSDTLEPAAEVLRAAGIMVIVSAGNDGPACATVTTPLANYDAVFSVGATSGDGDVVSFSSRGPVDGLIKPDVTAPGAYVRSSVPGGGYGYAGGTSMAGPHVAGLVALLWSANPALVGDIDATEVLICQTAAPKPVENACTTGEEAVEGPFAALLYNPVCACGGVTDVPNNVYGCGFIDAGAAVRAAMGQ
ncbi:MAG: S8 family serine peptidase [Anaerolineae bacterium]|nr:S8 family serine peptidase [Anaerolineae bacterium]